MAKQKLTVFLIKEEYEDFESVMRDGLVENEYNLNQEWNLDGTVYLGTNYLNTPEWLDVLREGVAEPIVELRNSSSRAVLLIRRGGRIFVIAFGFGRYMLKDEAIMRDFGIKVVLNSVNPDKLRSIDTTTFDELTIHSRTQTSKSTNVVTFGIDIVRDLLKSITGKPGNEIFGNVITGKDSVQFTTELSFRDFGTICDRLYEKYTSNEYRANFEWFDNLQMVSDPTLISTLNGRLIDCINSREDNRFHLAPPEIIDWTNIDGFSYTRSGETKDDLSVDDYFEYLNDREIDLDSLKRQHIYVWNEERTDFAFKWRTYECLVFETEFGEDIYILTVGMWFKISRVFSNRVKDYIATIENAEIELPTCRPGENEGDYNDRVSTECSNIITLDRKFVTIDGNQIEICDLLTEESHFIHVKPWKSSSTLSHLFSQGRVSASSLLQDMQFRVDTRSKIEEVDTRFTNIVNEAGIDPADIEVVFAIIDSDPRELHERLPFFSLLNMMHTVKFLISLGFRVTKYKIIRGA